MSIHPEAAKAWAAEHEAMGDTIIGLRARVAALEARCAKMAGALRPFADMGSWVVETYLLDETKLVEFAPRKRGRAMLTRGDFRLALEAFSPDATAYEAVVEAAMKIRKRFELRPSSYDTRPYYRLRESDQLNPVDDEVFQFCQACDALAKERQP